MNERLLKEKERNVLRCLLKPNFDSRLPSSLDFVDDSLPVLLFHRYNGRFVVSHDEWRNGNSGFGRSRVDNDAFVGYRDWCVAFCNPFHLFSKENEIPLISFFL
jgi:hypothetical protein